MKKGTLLLSTMLCCAATAWGQGLSDSLHRANVKTVTLTRSGVEMEPPVLAMDSYGTSNERMLLQFDLMADEGENLRYSIAHAHQTRISAEFQEPDGLLPLAGSNLLTQARASML